MTVVLLEQLSVEFYSSWVTFDGLEFVFIKNLHAEFIFFTDQLNHSVSMCFTAQSQKIICVSVCAFII